MRRFVSVFLSVSYLGVGVWLSINHSLAPAVTLLCFVSLAIVAYASKTLWLTVLAPMLALGSLYPWTGELVFCEYDIGLCALLGGRLAAHRWSAERTGASTIPALTLLDWLGLLVALVAFTAGLRGWLSLPPAISGDQLSLYTTSSNALQQSKVLFFGLALIPLLVTAFSDQNVDARTLAWSRIEAGFLASAVGVVAVVLAERFVTVGLWDWDEELRSAGPCMTMHIGDQHIDAYWAIVLPFVLPSRWSFTISTGLRCLLVLFVAYAIFATMSRATIVSALAIATLLVVAQSTYFTSELHCKGKVVSQPRSSYLTYKFVLGGLLGIVALSLIALILWNSGEAVPRRFANIAEGLQTRINHWQKVLQMGTRTQSQLWLGSGLGTYPIEYRKYVGRTEQPIRLVNHPKPDGSHSTGMQLVAGESIYAAQLVSPHSPLPWRVELKLRRAALGCGMQVSICHQVLLQSNDCIVPSPQFENADEDQLEKISFGVTQLPNDVVASKDKWRRIWSPTVLSLSATGNPGDSIEIYGLKATDAAGNSILRNSDHKSGSRFWFFVGDDYLVWRAENCLLHLFIETGLLGLCVVVTTCSLILARCLYIAIVKRSWQASVVFTATLGFLSIGMFGTSIDAPWLMLLTIIQLAIGHGLTLNRQ